MEVVNKDKQKQFILSENLWKVCIQLSWPAVIAMVLYGLNTVFDAIFVGRFVGATALAGISMAYPLTMIVIGLGTLIGVGAGSALSIALGANDTATQKRLLGNLNYISLVFGIIYTVAAVFFAEPLVRMMGGQGEVLILGTAYFRTASIGAFFWIHGLAGNMVVRAEGKMKTAAVMMAIGLIVNIIANYILIVILNMGVIGAAWGTNIGMLVYTLLGLIYFTRKNVSFEARPFKIYRDKDIMKSIFSMGMPALIMSVMTVIQGIVIFNVLSRYGTTFDIAFYGASFRILTLLFTPVFGLMRALQPVSGINFGAGENHRVIKGVKVFAFISIVLMFPFWLFIMIFPQVVLSTMLPGQIFSVANLINFRIFMALLPVLPITFMGMTFFPAINNAKPAAIIGIVRQLVFYIPVMLILPRFFGIQWVYWGSAAIDFVITLWVIVLLKKEFHVLKIRMPYEVY
jgi:putative MATE family efflux protein